MRLAIADGLAASKLATEYQREMVATLTGRDVLAGLPASELRRLLLTNVLDELDSEAEPAAGSGDILDEAADSLAGSYRQRVALWRLVPATSVAASTPAQALEAALVSLAEASGPAKSDDSFAARLPHELKAAQYLAGDDLHSTIALQRLLIDASARRLAATRPQHAAVARQIAAETLAASAGLTSALVQLRQQEAALLKLWMLYAPDA